MGLQEDYERFKRSGANYVGLYASSQRNEDPSYGAQENITNGQRLYSHVNIDNFTQTSPKITSYGTPYGSTKRIGQQFQAYDKKPVYAWQSTSTTENIKPYSKAFDIYDSKHRSKYGMSSPIKSIPKSTGYSKSRPPKLYKVLNDTQAVRNQINTFQTGPVLDNYKISKPHKPRESGYDGIFTRLRSYLNNLNGPEENKEGVGLQSTYVKYGGSKKVSFEQPHSAYSSAYNQYSHNEVDSDNDVVDDTIQQTKQLSTLLSKQREESLEKELSKLKHIISHEKEQSENIVRRHESETRNLHQSYKERIDHLNARIADLKSEVEKSAHSSDIMKDYEVLKLQSRNQEELISDLRLELGTLKAQLTRREQDISNIKLEDKIKQSLRQIKMKREGSSNELLLESKQIQLKIDNLESQYQKLKIDSHINLPSLIKENILDYEKSKRGMEKAISTLRDSNGKIDNSESSQIKSFIESLTNYLSSSRTKHEIKLETLDKSISSLDTNKVTVINIAKLLKKKFNVLLKLKSLNELSSIANTLQEYYEDSLALREIANKEDSNPFDLYSKVKFDLDNTLL